MEGYYNEEDGGHKPKETEKQVERMRKASAYVPLEGTLTPYGDAHTLYLLIIFLYLFEKILFHHHRSQQSDLFKPVPRLRILDIPSPVCFLILDSIETHGSIIRFYSERTNSPIAVHISGPVVSQLICCILSSI